jgi:hypothetical protein
VLIATELSDLATQVSEKLFDSPRQTNQPPAVDNNLKAIESSQEHRIPANRSSWRCRSVKNSEAHVLRIPTRRSCPRRPRR